MNIPVRLNLKQEQILHSFLPCSSNFSNFIFESFILTIKMLEYKRNLPHILPEDGVFFVTFRINNSLPMYLLTKLKTDYQKEIEV